MKPSRLFRIRDLLRRACLSGADAIERLAGHATALKTRKRGGDFATRADHASRDAIRTFLAGRAETRGIPVVDEETPASYSLVKGTGTFIVIDPLDGTILFRKNRRNPHWGIIAALVVNGRVMAAVLLQPHRRRGKANGMMFDAVRGHGCRLNGRQHTIPRTEESSALAVAYALPLSRSGDFGAYERIVRGLGRHNLLGVPFMLGCAAATCASVLFGETDFYLHPTNVPIWDVAAAGLLLEEARGSATTPGGRPLRWDRPAQPILFASGRKIGRRVVRAIA